MQGGQVSVCGMYAVSSGGVMNRLEQIIRAEIERNGAITFQRFMEMALYHPGLGYYASARTDIGRGGDFYTSPHLHPVFGMVMARQVEECWEAMQRPPEFTVVEQGGGRGFLAHDILDYLRGREIYGALRYRLIEMNPDMMERQRMLLSGFSDRVEWFSSLKEAGPFSGCFISNELPDSFPVHLVQMEREWKEVWVIMDGDRFSERLDSLSDPAIREYLDMFAPSMPEGYRTEVNLEMREWIRDVAGQLVEGFVVTVDYGHDAGSYCSEERSRGTLMCYFRHQAHEDPFSHVGQQDITAHVNFSALKKWGEEAGLETIGYAGQGIYMVSMGMDEIISEKYLGRDDYQFEVARMKGLILPGGMGESHKVMVQYRGDREFALRGFQIRNRVRVL